MMQSVISAEELTRLVLDDLFREFDDSRQRMRSLLRMLVSPPARRFARLAARFDETVAHVGFRESVRHVLSTLAHDVQRMGCEHIPETGPLLIASNHPGSYDSLLIAACLPRDDLKIIAAGFSMLRGLPNASKHLIFVESRKGSPRNFSVVRAAIRHLRSGGALLIFPGGCIEPDPTVLSGAAEALSGWSTSIELLMRKVPQTRVQISIVGGVLLPAFMRNPLITHWRGPRDALAVAGILQTTIQMLFPGFVKPRPTISFGYPKTPRQLRRENQSLHQSLIAEAGRLLEDHSDGHGCGRRSQVVAGRPPGIRLADN